MSYGVTPRGFVKKRLPEIRQEIKDDLINRLRAAGKDANIDTRPDSVIGLLIDTFADREAAVWEMQEGVYYAMYPDSANGGSLDKAVGIVGMQRLSNEKSKGYAVFYGSGAIPKGTKIKNKATQDEWETSVDGVISQDHAADVLISPRVADNHDYTVTIEATNYTFNSGAGASLHSILAGLVGVLSVAGLTVSSNGAVVRVISTEQPNLSFSLGSELSFAEIGTRIAINSVEYIARGAEIGELTDIITRIDGLVRVNNLEDMTIGRKTETDAELRTRHQAKKFGYGKATLPAFEIVLNEVVGVTAVRSFKNSTNIADAVGRPPHSVHIIVEGGLPEQIAQAIHKTVAAGIDTHGAISQLIETSEGKQLIKFDRPLYKYIHAKAVVTTLPDDEQSFISGGREAIKQAIAKVGGNIQIGTDVVTQRFYGEIYQTKGIASIDLQFAATALPNDTPGGFSSNNITIADYEKAVFDISRIEVT